MLNKITEFKNCLINSKTRSEGWDNLILYTQFICESSGNSELVNNANNPFSVKATPNWKGDTYLLKNNPEVINGKEIIIPDVFRKYPSFTEAIYNYTGMIKRIYPEAYENRGLYKQYFYWLIHGRYKYATDPLYVEKCLNKYIELDKQDLKEALNYQPETVKWPYA